MEKVKACVDCKHCIPFEANLELSECNHPDVVEVSRITGFPKPRSCAFVRIMANADCAAWESKHG